MIISAILLVIAAICNAAMDTLEHHWNTSIFRSISEKHGSLFWANPYEVSWRNKYVDGDPAKGRIKWNILGIKINKPVQITDAWHLFKTIMIFAIVGSIICAFESESLFAPWVTFILFGTVWNLTFSLFYNKVFRKK